MKEEIPEFSSAAGSSQSISQSVIQSEDQQTQRMSLDGIRAVTSV